MNPYSFPQSTQINDLSSNISVSRSNSTRQTSNAQSSVKTSFSQTLDEAQRGISPRSSSPPTNRWRSLNFLTTQGVANRITWPWTHSSLNQTMAAVSNGLSNIADAIKPQVTQLTELAATLLPPSEPLNLADYPHPPNDNGKGIHWIPTVGQSPEVVDRFVDEAVDMGMKWVVFLNEGTDIGANDYLVKRLTQKGMEPVMRVYTPGLVPIEGDIKDMVRHYGDLGVRYFQLYNEPNLMVETGGRFPDVERYLDLWIPAAQEVIEAGGLPGFGALSPQGEKDDRAFLREALSSLKARGKLNLLDRSWLAMHNYTGPRPLNDPEGFKRFQQYDAIIQAALGRSLPIIGTEGGTHITEHVSEKEQVSMVTGAYDYMMNQREPYNFAYTYWIIANGHDSAWDEHALIRPDGPTALAQALKSQVSGGQT